MVINGDFWWLMVVSGDKWPYVCMYVGMYVCMCIYIYIYIWYSTSFEDPESWFEILRWWFPCPWRVPYVAPNGWFINVDNGKPFSKWMIWWYHFRKPPCIFGAAQHDVDIICKIDQSTNYCWFELYTYLGIILCALCKSNRLRWNMAIVFLQWLCHDLPNFFNGVSPPEIHWYPGIECQNMDPHLWIIHFMTFMIE